MHHHLRKRHGDRRTGAAPFGESAERSQKLRNPGRVSGRGDTRASAAGGSQNVIAVWSHRAGMRRDCRNGTIFGARGEKRIDALDDRAAGAAEAGVHDAWRTAGSAIVAAVGDGEFQVEGGGGALFGHSKYW